MPIVDDDAGIATLVDEIFTDEGYVVTIMRDRHLNSVRAAVERLLHHGSEAGGLTATTDVAVGLIRRQSVGAEHDHRDGVDLLGYPGGIGP